MAKSTVKKITEEKKTTSSKSKNEQLLDIAKKEISKLVTPAAKKAKVVASIEAKAPKKAVVSKKTEVKPASKTTKKVVEEVVAKEKAKTATKKTAAPAKSKKEVTPAKETKKAPVKKKAELIDDGKLLAETIVAAMQEKKAKNITIMDLKKIGSRICDYFVICHATSNTQVDAIAHSVEDYVRKNIGEKPWHTEGFENSEWILVDYVDVVAHVFQEEKRSFYNIEELWADADIKEYENVE